jgi:hypothetical protein
MKKARKILSVIVAVIMITATVVGLDASAAGSVSVSGGTYNVGQTFKVTVSVSNSEPIMVAQINVSFDASVLTLTGVSGSDYTTGNGSVNIVDDDFSTATKN